MIISQLTTKTRLATVTVTPLRYCLRVANVNNIMYNHNSDACDIDI